ncbi:MAG: hypothetical protein ACJAVZ_002645 [Afipia broomeae]|jgi:hypothetical protein
MWTPAIPLLMGNWWTVASFAQPPEVTFGMLPSSEKRKSGSAVQTPSKDLRRWQQGHGGLTWGS